MTTREPVELKKRPNNGVLTHPLSARALDVLDSLGRMPVPTAEINPGICDRLTREELAEYVSLPSPYKVHKGGKTAHLQITEAGRKVLADNSKGSR
jgi:hypothetical protein